MLMSMICRAVGADPDRVWLAFDAEKSSSRTTKVIYNCLDPEHLHGKLPKRSSFHFAYPAEIQQRVLDNWTSYGYSADGALKESVTP